ncbi:MAG: nucleotidyltransferase substrate binding protein [Bacteroidales bacterium]|jgi:nucleotidyltransferase substrate binding protein (TIGR01987 family)|nr:nucleotidyltransferase substrate binding protein [Bacteroidales bacterium]
MCNKDIRWKQRFQNFEKAFLQLKDAVEKKSLNELERDGLLQLFKFSMELSWKIMENFLEEKGISFDKVTPKEVFRQAQQAGYITNVQTFIDGITLRNELSHNYNVQKFEKAVEEIRLNIFPALEQLYHFFIQEIKSEN